MVLRAQAQASGAPFRTLPHAPQTLPSSRIPASSSPVSAPCPTPLPAAESDAVRGVLDAYDNGQVESLLDPSDLAVLAIEPELPPLPSLDEGISEQLLLQVTGAPDLVNITHINLHGMGLEVVEGLSACPALQTLILSFNKLTKLDGLYGCSALSRLELGYNLIRRLDGLKGLMALTHLEMCHNALLRVEELTSLKKYTPNLIELDLRGNALCDSRAYRGLVMRRLPKLTLLDGLTVTDAERAVRDSCCCIFLGIAGSGSACEAEQGW